MVTARDLCLAKPRAPATVKKRLGLETAVKISGSTDATIER